MPFADKLNEFFYEGIGGQTSACLYGSAATGNWIDGRSDLDLIVLVPEGKLELLGQKVRLWTSTPTLPILDGYALSFSGSSLSATRLDQFLRVTYPSNTIIELIDKWNIKNRSKPLFGMDSINTLFPDISNNELRAWAINELKYISISNPENIVPEIEVKLSGLIWSVSWMARMLMLTRGVICDSKQEALQWLANEYSEIKDLVYLLLNDYTKSDDMVASITPKESVILRKFCFGLLQEIKE